MGLFGFGKRMENSRGGAFFGLILIAGAVFGLFVNEGRAVKRYKDLKEGAGAVVSIGSDKVDPANENKLIHLSGKTTTSGPVVEPVFGISETAIKVHRRAEMFQWVESTDSSSTRKQESEKQYIYKKEWRSDLVNSSEFKEKEGRLNPNQMKYKSLTTTASTVNLGAFTLPGFLIGKINNSDTLALANLEKSKPEVKKDGKLHNGGVYFGADPATPSVGDIRVSFSVVRPGPTSLVAQQKGSTLAKYGTKTGNTVELLEIGEHNAASMFQLAQDRNTSLTWILRGVGFAALGIGFSLLLGPLAAIASFIPLLGSVVGAGTKLIGFLLAAVVWIITVAVAWIFYRPLLGIGLLIVAVVLLVVIFKKLSQSKQVQAAPAGPSDASPPPFQS